MANWHSSSSPSLNAGKERDIGPPPSPKVTNRSRAVSESPPPGPFVFTPRFAQSLPPTYPPSLGEFT
ncbi:hypothetical protein EIP91_010686, partial [Steccherinum ochraceum]